VKIATVQEGASSCETKRHHLP